MDRDQAVRLLQDLNTGYLRAVEHSDVAWFDQHLAESFQCTNPDAGFLDKAGFLRQTAKPAGIVGLTGHDVRIQLLGDTAVIHAATSYTRADGSSGRGRYTDVWSFLEGRWQAVAAHVTRA